MAEAQLERSVLESKDREELFAIAEALGTKPSARAKKADLVTAILRATGVEDDAAPAPAARRTRAKKAAPAEEQGSSASADAEPVIEAPTLLDVAASTDSAASAGPAPSAAEAQPSEPADHDAQPDQHERQEGEGGSRRNRRRRGRDRERVERELQGGPVEVAYSGEPIPVSGLLDLRDEGYGFIRTEGFQAGTDDIYVSISQVRRFALRRGDLIDGAARPAGNNERYPALLRIDTVSGADPEAARQRPRFDDLTPIYPTEPLALEAGGEVGRVVDVVAPLGRGGRAVLVTPPRSGKTLVVRDLANAISATNPEIDVVVLLVDERPEEVTEATRSISGQVVAISFDHAADEQVQVAELVIERAKRLAEAGRDVVVVVDGATRLTRAYNLALGHGGRAPGSLDPVAVQMVKRFLGAARNTEEAGSLTMLATLATATGSKIDDAILDELHEVATTTITLDHDLAERRVHPPISVGASGTMHDDRLIGDDLTPAVVALRQSAPTVELLLERIRSTDSNSALIAAAPSV